MVYRLTITAHHEEQGKEVVQATDKASVHIWLATAFI